ncbi:MAG TPA: carboxymuconolactone decarboxylase family protein [Solirubrobacteraceae bacterium]|nr:carboxymuconolactone decarboxylase family protein [Solirubrobacteraceae bacterium]
MSRPHSSDRCVHRVSQLNGCAFCLDMHWKDARAAGETVERLAMLAATVINAWNRLSITARLEPGHYQPGMFG